MTYKIITYKIEKDERRKSTQQKIRELMCRPQQCSWPDVPGF